MAGRDQEAFSRTGRGQSEASQLLGCWKHPRLAPLALRKTRGPQSFCRPDHGAGDRAFRSFLLPGTAALGAWARLTFCPSCISPSPPHACGGEGRGEEVPLSLTLSPRARGSATQSRQIKPRLRQIPVTARPRTPSAPCRPILAKATHPATNPPTSNKPDTAKVIHMAKRECMPANRTNEAMDANARHAANGDQKHNLAATMALDLPSGFVVSEVDSLMVGRQGCSEKARCQ